MAQTSLPLGGMLRPIELVAPLVVAYIFAGSAFIVPASAAAQGPPNAPATVRQAQALLQAGRADGAVRGHRDVRAGQCAGVSAPASARAMA